ncbi:MAG: Pyridoxamine 5'-phosphate oxidase-related, FMN-binding [Candidatus Ozemobacter sibiricus]|uniref:Pyridoxamine 5'-phosphate oxidase-related, FMN-binding n=1 Tax=Candidatus Ozemobacter sibiricus TaxID=2268124 RepID=A0A367ZK57_9BACT|nr:MAG: Pyridoxamine 5'-phosphate oxidase-related, FMN-binding [Candidatus Ozemobacter sibiricus]
MSLKYAPNLSAEAMAKILREEDTGYLGLVDGDRPYVVPVSYAFLDETIVIHGAMTGRKLDLIRRNPRACFVVSRHIDRTRPHQAEGGCTYRFESVMCHGTARIIEEAGERLDWLRRFKDYFYRKLGLDPTTDPVTEKAAAACSCIVLTIETMTGRQKREAVAD